MKKIILPKTVYVQNQFMNHIGVLINNGTIERLIPESDINSVTGIPIEYWDNLALLPGTVNVHNHCFQSLLRGLAVGKPFLTWRDETLYKISPLLKPEDLYVGALFAFGEMMKYGVTTVCDYFYVHNDGMEGDEAIIQAAKDLGIRLVLARTMYDWSGAPSGYVEDVEKACSIIRHLAGKYNGTGNLMTTVLPAPHSLHAASLEMIKAGHTLAKDLGTKFHIHVAEEPFEVNDILNKYGLRPIELFDKIGVLDPSMVMIHAVWLDDHELDLVCKNGVNLGYCPSSNMFLADGVTRIDRMLEAGLLIGLGTDGACSNNRISVFEEMRMASLLQKVTRLNARLVNYDQAFNMGTSWGGQILDLPIGSIKIGMKADFVGVDTKDLSLLPVYENQEQLLPNIVYSMQPTAIQRVVVNGHTTIDQGHLCTISETSIGDRVNALMDRIYDQVKLR